MNIFTKFLARDLISQSSLGAPAGDPAAIERRLNHMATLTGGRGFRQYKRGPKVSKSGETRRPRKEAARKVYLQNLEREAKFRRENGDLPIGALNRAIETREHMRG